MLQTFKEYLRELPPELVVFMDQQPGVQLSASYGLVNGIPQTPLRSLERQESLDNQRNGLRIPGTPMDETKEKMKKRELEFASVVEFLVVLKTSLSETWKRYTAMEAQIIPQEPGTDATVIADRKFDFFAGKTNNGVRLQFQRAMEILQKLSPKIENKGYFKGTDTILLNGLLRVQNSLVAVVTVGDPKAEPPKQGTGDRAKFEEYISKFSEQVVERVKDQLDKRVDNYFFNIVIEQASIEAAASWYGLVAHYELKLVELWAPLASVLMHYETTWYSLTAAFAPELLRPDEKINDTSKILLNVLNSYMIDVNFSFDVILTTPQTGNVAEILKNQEIQEAIEQAKETGPLMSRLWAETHRLADEFDTKLKQSQQPGAELGTRVFAEYNGGRLMTLVRGWFVHVNNTVWLPSSPSNVVQRTANAVQGVKIPSPNKNETAHLVARNVVAVLRELTGGPASPLINAILQETLDISSRVDTMYSLAGVKRY